MPNEMTPPGFWAPDVKAARAACKPGEPLILRWEAGQLVFTLTQNDGATPPGDDDGVMVAAWRAPFDPALATRDALEPLATTVGEVPSLDAALAWINGFCEGWAARAA